MPSDDLYFDPKYNLTFLGDTAKFEFIMQYKGLNWQWKDYSHSISFKCIFKIVQCR